VTSHARKYAITFILLSPSSKFAGNRKVKVSLDVRCYSAGQVPRYLTQTSGSWLERENKGRDLSVGAVAMETIRVTQGKICRCLPRSITRE
jgi:hypothetical protein